MSTSQLLITERRMYTGVQCTELMPWNRVALTNGVVSALPGEAHEGHASDVGGARHDGRDLVGGGSWGEGYEGGVVGHTQLHHGVVDPDEHNGADEVRVFSGVLMGRRQLCVKVLLCIICLDLLNLMRSLKSDGHLIRKSYFIQRN